MGLRDRGCTVDVVWGHDHIVKIGGLPKLMPLDIDFQESCPTSAITKRNTHTRACTVAGWAGGFRICTS